jgi:hypothetical protein
VQGNPIVYLDIKLGRYGEGTPLGRVMIELKARRAAWQRLRRCDAPAARRGAQRACVAAWQRRGSRGAARVPFCAAAESPRARCECRLTLRPRPRRTSASSGALVRSPLAGSREARTVCAARWPHCRVTLIHALLASPASHPDPLAVAASTRRARASPTAASTASSPVSCARGALRRCGAASGSALTPLSGALQRRLHKR